MDKNLKAKWIKALRGGGYEQGDSMLYDSGNDSFCCLGVLCRVAGANLDEIDEVTMPSRTERFGTLIDEQIASHLANLNDDGVPFEMIAGFIDEAL